MEQGGTPKVIAITNGRGDFKDAVMAAVVDDDGKVKVQTKFDNLKDEADRMSFIELVEKHKPNVIVISGMSVQTARLRDDAYAAVRAVGCRTLGEDPPLAEGYSEHTNDFAEALAAFEQRLAHYLIPLIYVNDDTARQYMMSEESAQEFPGAPPNARYAVALARYTQNPLNAYCKLGKDIASITFMEHHQKLASRRCPRCAWLTRRSRKRSFWSTSNARWLTQCARWVSRSTLALPTRTNEPCCRSLRVWDRARPMRSSTL